MTKKYFITYGFLPESGCGYMLNSMEIHTPETNVSAMSPGLLAEYLEREVSKAVDNLSVVIINYWEL